MIDPNNIDYKAVATALLRPHLSELDKFSGWYEIVGDNAYGREDMFPKGHLTTFPPTLWSFTVPEHKKLTWKELGLKLGIDVEYLVDDWHDCKRCPNEKNCHALFKYDPAEKQPQCSYWQENVDKSVYEVNLKKYTKNEEEKA